MPSKTKSAAAADKAAQLQIPKELLDQLVTGALCRFEWNLTSSEAHDASLAGGFGWFKRTHWQVGQLGHAQVSNRNEVLGVAKPPSGPLGAL